MTCKEAVKKLYLMYDERVKTDEVFLLKEHIRSCFQCQKAEVSVRKLSVALKPTEREALEPSRGFEAAFWRKLEGRQRAPRHLRWLESLENLVHIPSPMAVAAVLLLSFFIGGTGGVFSMFNQANLLENHNVSAVRYLSGFHEFRGIPTSSVAGSYFKMMVEEAPRE